jgi:uncharacterized membrane protein
MTERATPATPPVADLESEPLTRAEYISALVHLYRGQLARADAWRLRLDTTSNWALVTTMGVLSFAFSTAPGAHASPLVGMVMVTHFLLVEARRYRIFDVWNSRVRMIEENFYGPILTRDLKSPRGNWGGLVAHDLLKPRFKCTYLQAFRARLVRNYSALFLLLLLGWLVRAAEIAHAEGGTWREALAFGVVPASVSIVAVTGLYLFLVLVGFLVEKVHPPESELWQAGRRMEEGH